MARHDFSSFGSRVVSGLYARGYLHVVVFDIPACKTLSQTMATATVNLLNPQRLVYG
jgi:hypothetical protein